MHHLLLTAAAGLARRCDLHPLTGDVPKYNLAREYSGDSFFDGWNFGEHDWTNGATQYVNRSAAEAERIVQAFQTHAIIRTGGRGSFLKRKSVRISSRDSWMYALITMRFTHLPYGCGAWPAFWLNAASGHWPGGGELDILEYVNFGKGSVTFHTGGKRKCTLEPAVVQECDDFETERVEYNCYSDYLSGMLGCGPNKPTARRTGLEWAGNPGVLAAEWTAAGIKVFAFGDDEIPPDLLDGAPTPARWDKWIIAYFPFAASQQVLPGLCPAPATLLEPQSIVLNIALCGDWASQNFMETCSQRIPDVLASDNSGRCVTIVGGTSSPLYRRDCCMSYVYDAAGAYGADTMLQTAYFNITWLKVYQTQPRPDELLAPSPPPRPPSKPPPASPPAPPSKSFLAAAFPWSVVAAIELGVIAALFAVLLIPGLHARLRLQLWHWASALRSNNQAAPLEESTPYRRLES